MAKILVIRGGAIGDFILTLPAIALIKEGLPAAQVSVLGYRPIVDLAMAAGVAEEVRSMEHGPLAGFFAPGTELDPDWKAYFGGFNLVVSYLHDQDGHFKANLERAGVKTLIEGIAKVDPNTGMHAARQLAAPLESLALYLEQPGPQLGIPAEQSDGKRRVAIHPGSGGVAKNWQLEYWIELGKQLAADHTVQMLLVTGEAEEKKTREIADAWRDAGLEFQHSDGRPLPELAGQLAGCTLFIGHDSGISHLAAAAGAPCLLLFGPTDPAVWAPANPGVEVIRSTSGQMAGISYEEVFERAGALLSCPSA